MSINPNFLLFHNTVLLKRFFICSLFWVANTTFAGMTVDSYKSATDTDDVNIYLAGLLNGFAFANTELWDQKRKQLFCPPSDLAITVQMGRSYLEQGFKRYNKLGLPMLEIEPLLLRELIDAYPCNKRQ